MLLVLTGLLFFAFWAWLCIGMLMAWVFQGVAFDIYGALTAGVLLYGVGTIIFTVVTLIKPSPIKEGFLWVLYLPVPLGITLVLELLY
jgi:hypothetical protein